MYKCSRPCEYSKLEKTGHSAPRVFKKKKKKYRKEYSSPLYIHEIDSACATFYGSFCGICHLFFWVSTEAFVLTTSFFILSVAFFLDLLSFYFQHSGGGSITQGVSVSASQRRLCTANFTLFPRTYTLTRGVCTLITFITLIMLFFFFFLFGFSLRCGSIHFGLCFSSLSSFLFVGNDGSLLHASSLSNVVFQKKNQKK